MDPKVLIVDDEARFASSLKTLFKHRGIQARISLNGQDAIAKFRKTPVKVVITDIHMPGRNGFEFMEDLVREDRLTQVIFLTGDPRIDHVKRAFRLNAFDFFKKPVAQLDALADAVASAQKAYDRLKEKQETRERIAWDAKAFDMILNGMDAAIVVRDMDSCDIVFANTRFKRDLGYGPDQALRGRKCLEVIHDNRADYCRFCTNTRILDPAGHPSGTFEWEMENHRTGTRYTVVDKAIQWVDKRMVRLSVFYDITEKRKQDILFRKYEKKIHRLSELGRIRTLAGGIAHQFNNSLSVISGNLELMEMELARERRDMPYARAMRSSADKMADLTTSLLAYARGGAYRIQPRFFRDLVTSILDDLIPGMPDHIRIFNRVAERSHVVRTDNGQIRMLLSNILDNAREAGAGTIEIHGGDRLHSPPQADEYPGAPRFVRLGIRDDGQGMDQDTLDRVFQPFFTTKFQGRGLGLAAAMGIVKGHKGFLFMESRPHCGTLATIYLPVDSALSRS